MSIYTLNIKKAKWEKAVTKEEIDSEISSFADHIMGRSVKWNTEDWVRDQYQHHIEECDELRRTGDDHLNAELIDKAIIATVLYKLVDFDNTKDMEEIYDMDDFRDTFSLRKDKFISKIHL